MKPSDGLPNLREIYFTNGSDYRQEKNQQKIEKYIFIE